MHATNFKSGNVEDLNSWIASRPNWEQYVWSLAASGQVVGDESIEESLHRLLATVQLGPLAGSDLPSVSIPKLQTPDTPTISEVDRSYPKLNELKDLRGINALDESCSVQFDPHLTLIFGVNGSGKSGVCRLLADACFARGVRPILPNVRSTTPTPAQGATFVISDGPSKERKIQYSLGDDVRDLKRFFVFDAQSVSIHIDSTSTVRFTPAHVQVFDKVFSIVGRLEKRLREEVNAHTLSDPFAGIFPVNDVPSALSQKCLAISGKTSRQQLEEIFAFRTDTLSKELETSQEQLDRLLKLDVPRRKAELIEAADALRELKEKLDSVAGALGPQACQAYNKLIAEILAKRVLLKQVSVESIDDSILATIGSPEWKSLLEAARVVHNAEHTELGSEPTHCVLCHQTLGPKEKSLFTKYWAFLESKAEEEHSQLLLERQAALEDLDALLASYPTLPKTEIGPKILRAEAADYFSELSAALRSGKETLKKWITWLRKLEEIPSNSCVVVDTKQIDAIRRAKEAEDKRLKDPGAEISALRSNILLLQHRKLVAPQKAKAFRYLEALKWIDKASRLNVAATKQITTKKRTQLFLAGVAVQYREAFNRELKVLDAAFDLVMLASGEEGRTVKEYRFEFAKDYAPSDILSDGEQNVCALADFLAEAIVDSSNLGIILDDPVTSLDHRRRDLLAARLAQFATRRQVIVFTHDLTFMSQLVRHAESENVPYQAHWMETHNGVPGSVHLNSSPKLTSVASLRGDAESSLRGFESLEPKEKERALGSALSYLRSGTEALVEELLFARTLSRYEDHVKVTNLEEAVFDSRLGLRIVDLHGNISGALLAHNRSDERREANPSRADFDRLLSGFDELVRDLKAAQKEARKERENRKKKSAW